LLFLLMRFIFFFFLLKQSFYKSGMSISIKLLHNSKFLLMLSFIRKLFLNNLLQAFSFCLCIYNIDIIFLLHHLSLFLPIFFSFFENHIFQFILPSFCFFTLFLHLFNLLQLFLFNSL
jgi:hypothetical protein